MEQRRRCALRKGGPRARPLCQDAFCSGWCTLSRFIRGSGSSLRFLRLRHRCHHRCRLLMQRCRPCHPRRRRRHHPRRHRRHLSHRRLRRTISSSAPKRTSTQSTMAPSWCRGWALGQQFPRRSEIAVNCVPRPAAATCGSRVRTAGVATNAGSSTFALRHAPRSLAY